MSRYSNGERPRYVERRVYATFKNSDSKKKNPIVEKFSKSEKFDEVFVSTKKKSLYGFGSNWLRAKFWPTLHFVLLINYPQSGNSSFSWIQKIKLSKSQRYIK